MAALRKLYDYKVRFTPRSRPSSSLRQFHLFLSHTPFAICIAISCTVRPNAMTSRSYGFVCVLLVLLALVAMASAQPNGDGYDPMDIDFFDDALFQEVFGTLTNDELARMVSILPYSTMAMPIDTFKATSPPQAYIDPSQLSQPFPAFYEGGRASLSSTISGAERAHSPSRQREQPQTYAAVARRAIAPLQQVHARTTDQQAMDYKFTQQQASQQASTKPYAPCKEDFTPGPLARSKTYAEALRSPPLDLDLESWLDSLETPDPLPGAPGSSIAGALHHQQPSHLLGDAITQNANFHAGVTDAHQSVEGWVSQPRTARDRIVPRLDTSRLYPYTPSAYRSPGSVTSPSSSRISNRRSKQQLLSGNHKHRCDVCRAGFDTKSDLTHHLRNHTPYELRPHPCTTCGKRFPYAKDLKRHLVVHAKNVIFCPHASCKHASKGFSRQDHYERHMTSQHAVDSARPSSQPPSSLGLR